MSKSNDSVNNLFSRTAGLSSKDPRARADEYFKSKTGLRDPRDAERVWLKSQGAVGSSSDELWRDFLRKQGKTGSLNDMKTAYFSTVTLP